MREVPNLAKRSSWEDLRRRGGGGEMVEGGARETVGSSGP